jgi:hypothetical protein
MNQFSFDIAGGSNQVVTVEASTKLVNWTALATNTLGVTALPFTTLDKFPAALLPRQTCPMNPSSLTVADGNQKEQIKL